MKSLKPVTKFSFVYIFVAVAVLALSVYSSNAFASEKPKAKDKGDVKKEDTTAEKNTSKSSTSADASATQTEAVLTALKLKDAEDKKTQACIDLGKEFSKASGERQKACTGAGLGLQECSKKVQTCREQTEEMGDALTSPELMQAIGAAGGMAQQMMSVLNTSTSYEDPCPLYTEEQWQKRQKEIQDDLDQARKDLAEAETDQAKDKAESEEAIKDLNDQAIKLNKDLEDLKVSLSQEQREKKQELEKQIQGFKKETVDIQNQMQKVRNEITKTLAKKANQLPQYFKQCARMAQEAQAKLNQAKASQRGPRVHSSAAHLVNRKKKEVELLRQQYTDCMSEASKAKKEFVLEINSQIDSLKGQLVGLEESLKDVNQNYQTALNNQNQFMQELMSQMNAKQKEVAQTLQQLQQAVFTEKQKQAQIAQAHDKKIQALNTKIAMLSNELTKLGGTTIKGAKKDISQVDEASSSAIEAANGYYAQCCESQKQFGADKVCENASKISKEIQAERAVGEKGQE